MHSKIFSESFLPHSAVGNQYDGFQLTLISAFPLSAILFCEILLEGSFICFLYLRGTDALSFFLLFAGHDLRGIHNISLCLSDKV